MHKIIVIRSPYFISTTVYTAFSEMVDLKKNLLITGEKFN